MTIDNFMRLLRKTPQAQAPLNQPAIDSHTNHAPLASAEIRRIKTVENSALAPSIRAELESWERTKRLRAAVRLAGLGDRSQVARDAQMVIARVCGISFRLRNEHGNRLCAA